MLTLRSKSSVFSLFAAKMGIKSNKTMETPIINKTYNYFDDGKISESRREHVLITRLIKFEDATKKLVKEWKKEVKQCHWLYKTETDFFVEGFIKDTDQKVIFVRCKNEGWFSLGWYAGRLDIDGSLFERMFNNEDTTDILPR